MLVVIIPVQKLVSGCREACLFTAGRGAFSNVMNARIRKTKLFFEQKDEFLSTLKNDLTLFSKYCKDNNITPYARLNGTSDISWEKYGVFSDHPDINFYDYTKVHNRKVSSHPNYHLTYSRSEESTEQDLIKALDSNMNVAVVFAKELPVVWRINNKDVPVINGDKDDLRIKDAKSVVVGLLAKGLGKKDTTGFVVYA